MKQLENLPYAYNALEPYIDEQTMRLHHDKHHQTYFDKFLAAIENYPELKNENVKEILRHLNKIPSEIKTAVVNHGGGYYNHNFFWTILKKDVKFEGEISKEILKKWGSFDKFKEEFKNNALGVFGSGWTWLVLDKNELKIVKTANQDSVISLNMIPLLTIDVWEHAYYLKYQNKRMDYVEAFFNVINWKKVNEYYLEVRKNDKNK
ncbi:superoxide dismutase [Candidatus Woesearchaeota archaeon]|nr:superoxide dismutase [Candidatus Woesearchaeota archaeon]